MHRKIQNDRQRESLGRMKYPSGQARNRPRCQLVLFIRVVQVLVQNFSHGEHVHSVLLKNGAHGIVASDLSTVTGILELVFPDVFPDLFHRLRP